MSEYCFYGNQVTFLTKPFNSQNYGAMGLNHLENTETFIRLPGLSEALLEAINGTVADKNVKGISYCFIPLETLENVPPVTLLMKIYYLSEISCQTLLSK